jgi:hypothetical protein
MVHKEKGGDIEIWAAATNKGQHYDKVCWQVARGTGGWSIGSKGGGGGVGVSIQKEEDRLPGPKA